jgi:hypothetical protein
LRFNEKLDMKKSLLDPLQAFKSGDDIEYSSIEVLLRLSGTWPCTLMCPKELFCTHDKLPGMFKHRRGTGSKSYNDPMTPGMIFCSQKVVGVPKFETDRCKKERANKYTEMSRDESKVAKSVLGDADALRVCGCTLNRALM